MNAILRPCTEADLDELFSLDQICFRAGIAYSIEELSYYLRQPRILSQLAEEEQSGTVLGFVIAEYARRATQVKGHIVTIDIAPPARRHGIGTLLLDRIERDLIAHGASSVRLETAVDNAPAQAFYVRSGYRQTGRIAGYYLGTLDALIMEKQLSPLKRGHR